MSDPAPFEAAVPPSRLRALTGSVLGTAGSRVAAYAILFLTSLLISRTLGPEGRGAYALPVSAALLFAGLFHLSLAQAAIRAHGQKAAPLHDLASQLSGLGWLLGLAGGAALFAFSWLAVPVARGTPPGSVVLAALAVPFSIQILYMESLFSLSHRIRSANRVSILSAFFHLVGAVALKAAGRLTPGSVVLLHLAGFVLTWSLLRILLRKEIGPSGPFSWPAARSLLSTGLRAHGGILLWFLHLRLGLFLLKGVTDLHQAGLYSLAVSLAEIVWLATDAVALAILPYQAETNAAESARLTAKAVRLTGLAALPLAGVLAAAAPLVLAHLYGPAFGEAAFPLWTLLPGVIAMTAQRLAWVYLLRFGNLGQLTGLMAFQVALNAVLTLTLASRWGSVGAAMAAAVSYLLGTGLVLAEFRRASRVPWCGILRPEPGEIRALAAALRAWLRRS